MILHFSHYFFLLWSIISNQEDWTLTYTILFYAHIRKNPEIKRLIPLVRNKYLKVLYYSGHGPRIIVINSLCSVELNHKFPILKMAPDYCRDCVFFLWSSIPMWRENIHTQSRCDLDFCRGCDWSKTRVRPNFHDLINVWKLKKTFPPYHR